MPDRIVRIIVLGSTSDAQAKMAALAATTDVSADDMTGSMGRMTSTVGGFTSRLGSKLQALGIPFSGVLVNAGKKLDNTTTKGQKFGQAMLTTASAVTAATVVAGAGVAAFSIKAGMDLQAAAAGVPQCLLNLFPVQRADGQPGFRRLRRSRLGRCRACLLARPNRSAGRHQSEHRGEC